LRSREAARANASPGDERDERNDSDTRDGPWQSGRHARVRRAAGADGGAAPMTELCAGRK